MTVLCEGERKHDGYILGSTSAKTGHVKISGLPNSIVVQNNFIKPFTEDQQSKECLHGLVNVKVLKLLHILTQWSKQWNLIKKNRNQQQENVGSHHKRKRTKKANEDVVSNVLTREIKKRSSR